MRGSLVTAPRSRARAAALTSDSAPADPARAALRRRSSAAMPAASWLASQAEHCARFTPECFEENPSAIYIFLNGGRTFSGVQKLSPTTLVWGDGVKQPVNACVDTIPPRLTDEDIGITPEQWASFIADLNQTFEALPPDPAMTMLSVGLVNDGDWKAAVRKVCEAHTTTTFARGVGALCFEEAFWTEVVPPPKDAPREDQETGFRDPVTQPRTMPVVIIRLHFPSRAAFLRYVEDRVAAETAPPGSAAAAAAQQRMEEHGKRAHVDRRVSLLPWEKRWALVPPQRMFGHRASYHVGV